MNVQSLTIVHYGQDYLSYALRSVYHQVDKLHVFYTPTPSHGHQTNIPPIETREELMAAAGAYNPQNKIHWYDMAGVTHEGPQRDLALKTVAEAGAELVVVVDCDEIWPAEVLANSLSRVGEANTARNWLVNMVHFWRSFDWACSDQGWPVRIIDLRQQPGETRYLDTGRVYHFGYAVRNQVMQYKWKIHGHKDELRAGWLEKVWLRWPPLDDCHPTNGCNERGEPFWTPKPFDKTVLPEFMKSHPFYGLEMIG